MRIVISGGSGFLGSLVAQRLLDLGTFQGETIDHLVLTDRVAPDARIARHPQVQVVTADLASAVPTLFTEPVDTIIHLASAVSAEVEADPDLGMSSNIDATRALLNACRAQSSSGRLATLVFSSSVAVYGSDAALPMPAVVDEATVPMPQSSYGAQKLACESFISDATRKGYVDGRIVRLMTVVVRPGKPNAAASGFLSSIVREPLAGLRALCPVDPDMPVAISSPARTISGILTVGEAKRGSGPGELNGRLPVNLPALTVTVRDLLDALESVAGQDVQRLVQIQPDPAIEAIVGSWPSRFANQRASALGLEPDRNADDVVREFVSTQNLQDRGI